MPYKNSLNFFKTHFQLIFVIVLFLFLGFYRIDQIPGEWFGDISLVNNYVTAIIQGQHPFYLSTSLGPLYYYLVAPIVRYFGSSYLIYKYLSIIIGAFGLVCIYFFVRQISSKRIAILSILLTGTSFWYLVWSRLGTSGIIFPLLSSLTMLFLMLYLKKYEVQYLILGLMFSSLGLFTYSGCFLLFPLYIFIVLYKAVRRIKPKELLKLIFILFFVSIPIIIMFLNLITNDQSGLSPQGYLGAKIFNTFKLTPGEILFRLINNIYRTLTMFHLEGDVVFRWNVSKSPHLDSISGLFLLVGLIFFFLKYKNKFIYIFFPMLILVIPSILPSHPPAEIPSNIRTIAILPFIFFLVAYGIDVLYLKINNYLKPIQAKLLLFIILISIIYTNLFKYFIVYPTGLPNKNVPFGKIIAKNVDNLPKDTKVFISDYGWGDWGQPEIDSIYYSINNKSLRNNTSRDIIDSCNDKRIDYGLPIFIIFNPYNTLKINYFKKCVPNSILKEVIEKNTRVFTYIYRE